MGYRSLLNVQSIERIDQLETVDGHCHADLALVAVVDMEQEPWGLQESGLVEVTEGGKDKHLVWMSDNGYYLVCGKS